MFWLYLLAACGGGEVEETGDPTTVGCTDIAFASVVLTVEDEAGQPVSGAAATWSLSGGSAAACDVEGDTFTCGWEVAGEIDVAVTAPGYTPWMRTVTVGTTADECHVVTESLTATLSVETATTYIDTTTDPTTTETTTDPCTDTSTPALLVTVVDAYGGPSPVGATVTYEIAGTILAPALCDAPVAPDVQWACAYGLLGEVFATATAPGYDKVTDSAMVLPDACNDPISEELVLSLTPVPVP